MNSQNRQTKHNEVKENQSIAWVNSNESCRNVMSNVSLFVALLVASSLILLNWSIVNKFSYEISRPNQAYRANTYSEQYLLNNFQ